MNTAPTLVLINGINITGFPEAMQLLQLVRLLQENGFECSKVMEKQNLLRFSSPELEGEGHTLLIFNNDGKLSFCRHTADGQLKPVLFFNDLFKDTVEKYMRS